MQFVLPSPSVRGGRASPSLCESEEMGQRCRSQPGLEARLQALSSSQYQQETIEGFLFSFLLFVFTVARVASHLLFFFSCAGSSLPCTGFSWDLQAQLGHGMWDLVPQPGIEPLSPALAGGFLTTGPPGKSPHLHFENTALAIVWSVEQVWRWRPSRCRESVRRMLQYLRNDGEVAWRERYLGDKSVGLGDGLDIGKGYQRRLLVF